MRGVWRYLVASLAVVIIGSSFLVVLKPYSYALAAPHDPILIQNDSEFNSTNGVTAGSGTAIDPFIIDGWGISAYGVDGVQIANTTAHFIIRNVTVSDGGWGWSGISLVNVTNATVEDCVFPGDNNGVVAMHSPGTVVRNCTFTNVYGGTGGMSGVRFVDSNMSTVVGCTSDNYYALAEVENCQDVSVIGNKCTMLNTRAMPLAMVTHSNNTTVADNTATDKDGVCWLWYSTNSAVINNTANACGQGVYVYFSNSTRIVDNEIYNSNENGIWLSGSDNITVSNNTVKWSQRYGVYIDRTTNCSISGNGFERDGIVIKGETLAEFNSHTISTDNVITHVWNSSIVTDPIYYFKDTIGLFVDGISAGQIIVADCIGVVISDVNMTDTDIGVQMGYVSDVVLTDVNVSNCLNGIRIYDCSELFLLDSHIHNNHGWVEGYGLQLEYGVEVAVVGNTFESNAMDAINIVSTVDLTIAQNEVVSNYQGINLYSENYYTTVERNNVTGSTYDGIVFTGGSHAIIVGNNASGNGWRGVYVGFTDNVNVIGNNLSDNRWGVMMNYAYSCNVYHNNFWQSTEYQAEEINECVVSWNNGYPSGGNFWSDYVGLDQYGGPAQDQAGSDGMGDSPYKFPPDFVVEDRYPLMAPYGVSNFPPVAYLDATVVVGDTTTLFEFNASDSWDLENDPSSLQYRWDWEGDGVWDTSWTTEPNATRQFVVAGTYNVTVEVMDGSGLTDTASMQIVVIEVIPEFDGVAVIVVFVMMSIVVIRKRFKAGRK